MKRNKAFKRLGYYDDREGIMRRYILEREAWAIHLENTQQAVKDFAKNKDRSQCLVFGSGWWLDVPTEFLCSHFNKVVFADISHPAQILKKAKSYKNLSLITVDVTGAVSEIWNYIKLMKRKSRLEAILDIINNADMLNAAVFPPSDYYVSVNILSQLSVFIRRYLNHKTSLSSDEIHLTERRLQERHLELLSKGESCLITDYNEICIERKTGKRTKRKLIYTDLPDEFERREWTWTFDRSGNYKNCRETTLEVIALDLAKQS